MMDLSSLRELAEAATPGPWSWFGQIGLDYYLATKDRGRIFVMGFERMGMNRAQPSFQVYSGERQGDGSGLMTKASNLAVKEVPYRKDIVGFDNPDATWIAAASPTVVLELLDEIQRLKDQLMAEYIHAQSPSDWIGD